MTRRYGRRELQNDYGVDSDHSWVEGAIKTRRRPGVPRHPGRESRSQQSGKPMSDRSRRKGRRDGRPPPRLAYAPHVVLSSGFKEVEKGITAHRLFPIMHIIAIKREVYEKHRSSRKASIARRKSKKRRSWHANYPPSIMSWMRPSWTSREVFGTTVSTGRGARGTRHADDYMVQKLWKPDLRRKAVNPVE